MARTDSLGNFLQDIADAIRSKTGKTNTMSPSSFDTEIEGIATGGETITNGVVFSDYQQDTYGFGMTVPRTATTIGIGSIPHGFFSGASYSYGFMNSLQKIILNDGLGVIYAEGFRNCKASTIVLPNSLTTINGHSFYGANVTEINAPNVTAIGGNRYSGSGMGTSYPNNTFNNCSKLTRVYLPRCNSTGTHEFYNCTALEEVTLGSETNVLTLIANYMFAGCKKLTTLNLSSAITAINPYAFQNCTALNLTELPPLITKINNYAFHNCTALALTKLPDTLTTLGTSAFMSCSNMALTELPETLVTIGGSAFSSVGEGINLSKLPGNLTSIGSSAFYKCNNRNLKTIPTSYTSFIGTSTFYANELTQLSMPNITYISGSSTSNGGLAYCTYLMAIWMGSSLTNSMGSYALYADTSLTKIFIDLPRAIVETYSGYSTQWGASNATIICNDDEDFMTQEEFDAIDWMTYTE